ncbi:hypothetical protein DZA07_32725 [Pseudomonas aeruginosa]|nr:hypothetical protein CD799_30925 [Pseudomonas aeruginosa]AZM84149.1 hypothetical protein EIP87_19685 [Pseudomonas aeruginosa]AZZ15879.1 hypothetical protein CEK59_31045 [Pseudomonas aeruginosa]MDV6803961.1 hypothetical protein [Pseudomonas aeruginosa]OPE16854.1 hypothetical protein APA83_33205 [Pseudomonas aeruginosa]
MPIPPPPLTFICPRCSWQKTTVPRSDALLIGRDCYTSCPKCGTAPVVRRMATSIEAMRARLEHLLRLDRH